MPSFYLKTKKHPFLVGTQQYSIFLASLICLFVLLLFDEGVLVLHVDEGLLDLVVFGHQPHPVRLQVLQLVSNLRDTNTFIFKLEKIPVRKGFTENHLKRSNRWRL